LVKARHTFSALFVAFAIAGSCTNDFDKFDASGNGDGDGDGTNGGSSSGTSSTGGSVTGGTAGTAILGGSGGNAGRGGTGPIGGTAGTAGAAGSGEAGAAGTPGCAADEKECDGSCVPLADPATGCGSPDTCEPCEIDHATAACATDECSIDRCDDDWGDCNMDLADGCEQTLDDTIVHCGACDRACATAGVASVECNGGLCVSSCAAGSANCTTPSTGADDGCETSTASDAENCGGCGNDCTAQGLGVCSAGLCGCSQSGQCGNGSGVDCVGGACSCDAIACRPGERCRRSGGDQLCACNGGAACGAAEVCCQTPAGCTDVQTSPASCGACGRACTAGFTCSAGACDCDGDEDCDAGMPEVATGAGGEGGGPSTGPSCVSGRCVCGTTTCAEGQRCLDGGGCG
jgi:hypothetical protein